MDSEYGPLREDEVPALVPILSWSFCFPAADVEPWIRRGGLQNVRVLRRRGRLDACLLLIPMGQFFGGKSVPMTGIAGVATAAEARGAGGAAVIMAEALRELAAQKAPLSALYPATRALYRKVGYEPAGCRYETTVPLSTLPVLDRALELRAITEADEPAVRALYGAAAIGRNGFLDRGPYVWDRVKNPRGEGPVRGFVVAAPAARELEGYLFLYEKRNPSLHYDLVITDLAFTSEAAARRLVTFFADHGTLGERLRFNASPDDPLVHALPAVGAEQRVKEHWMLRVVHVAEALARRGYPEWIKGELAFDLEDDVLPENAGRYVLSVAGGRAEVRRGGRGTMKLHVRGLAALYSGHLSPRALVLLGLAAGTDADLAQASAIFGVSPPTMPDFF